jgi:hypothetical protein
MTNLLCKVHPDAKRSSAYVVVTEPTGSEGHPLPAVGGDPVVQACARLALQQAAHLAPLRATVPPQAKHRAVRHTRESSVACNGEVA